MWLTILQRNRTLKINFGALCTREKLLKMTKFSNFEVKRPESVKGQTSMFATIVEKLPGPNFYRN